MLSFVWLAAPNFLVSRAILAWKRNADTGLLYEAHHSGAGFRCCVGVYLQSVERVLVLGGTVDALHPLSQLLQAPVEDCELQNSELLRYQVLYHLWTGGAAYRQSKGVLSRPDWHK